MHVRRGVLLALVLGGCFQASHEQPTATPVGPEGGTVRSPDGRASVEIPAGALSATTPISVALAATPSPLPGTAAAGPAYTITPTLELGQPARVTLPLEPAPAPHSHLEVELARDGRAEALDTTAQDSTTVQTRTWKLGTFVTVRVLTPTPDGGATDSGSPGSCGEVLPDLSDVLLGNDAGIGGCDLFAANGGCWHAGYACQTSAFSCFNGGAGLPREQVTTSQGWCVIVSSGGPCPGWPCQSDSYCGEREQCVSGSCQEVACPAPPVCPGPCVPYREPHGCEVCVCNACPYDDGGVAPPTVDAG